MLKNQIFYIKKFLAFSQTVVVIDLFIYIIISNHNFTIEHQIVAWILDRKRIVSVLKSSPGEMYTKFSQVVQINDY